MNQDAYLAGFASFIQASPSSFHAAAEVARQLEHAGFIGLDERDEWTFADPAASGYFVVRDGAIIAWRLPGDTGAAGTEAASTPASVTNTATVPHFRIVGAHTDSPGFKLKTKPTFASNGWLQAGVEIYGGPLLNSWLDRELELAGRLVARDGTQYLVRTGPYLRIPQLAVHLDRDVNNGLTLDKQRHLSPVFGVGELSHGDLVEHLATLAGIAGDDVAGYDLITADTAAPARFGLDASLFAAGRMDNLSSVYAALVALLDDVEPVRDGASGEPNRTGQISVLAAFDHEEIGSESRSGAAGPFLAEVTDRILEALGATTASDTARSRAASWVVSSDAGHAVHPNYPERHDPANRPVAGGGPLLKINANQRYATDAHGAALWVRLCAAAGVPFQEFVSNNTIPCGSTIGPITSAKVGMRTVDVGIPLLSMHSARELCHVDDAYALARVLTAYYAGA